MPREGQTDSIQLGFKGMATAGGNYGADNSYLESLTNAYVTQDGSLVRRPGSTFLYGVDNTSLAPEIFQFQFKGFRWFLHRFGVDFRVYRVLETNGIPYSVDVAFTKNNVLRTASATEPATYAVVVKGNYCHVLIATASTQLVSISLTARDITWATLPTGTTATATLTPWFTPNFCTNTNTRLLTSGSVAFQPTTTVSQATTTATFTWSTRPAEVVVGAKATMFACFWMRFCDATFYPGSALFDTALRRNSVPLDVNVQLPDSLSSNPIFNEPLQDLDYETYRVFDTNVTNAPRQTKVTNRQPVTNVTWDFGDGSYRVASGQLSNRTPNFIAYGGLLAGGNINTRVYVARLRTILIAGFSYPSISDMGVFSDKLQTFTPSWHLFDGNQIGVGEPKYISASSNTFVAPGVNQESVVELIYRFNASGTAALTGNTVNDFVDISPDADRHVIADGIMCPLYGYNLVTTTKSFSFPNVVRIVGNRLVLCGNGASILVSSADWNYRGITFNNCQVSTQDFGENSAYLVTLAQSTANVVDVLNVNGVLVCVTSDGVFTVAGRERTSPPNAVTAIVTRLTDQVFRRDCTYVLDNTVYLANINGLFKLNYIRESDKNVLEPLSLAVESLFRQEVTQGDPSNFTEPLRVTYSRSHNSLLLQMQGRRKLLTYNMRSESWSYTQVAVPLQSTIFPTLDGFVFATGAFHIVVSFDRFKTIDLDGISFLVSYTLLANTQTVLAASVSEPLAGMVSPPELVNFYTTANNVVPAFNGRVRAVGGNCVLTETVAGNVSKPIIASAVTKVIYTDKLQRAQRLREVHLLVQKPGTVRVAVVPNSSTNSTQLLQTTTFVINNHGQVTFSGDKAKATTDIPVGNTVVARLSCLGIDEAFSVAFELGATEVSGLQVNTSAKSLSKLS
jgi:hypothetical protein